MKYLFYDLIKELDERMYFDNSQKAEVKADICRRHKKRRPVVSDRSQ